MLAVLAVLLGACSADPDSTGSSRAGESGSPAATETAGPEPTGTVFDADEPTLPGGVRVLSQAVDDFVSVDGGRYGVRVSDSLLYQVNVPDRSEVFGGNTLNPGSGGASGRNGMLWMDVADQHTALPKDPCHDHTYQVVGPTVEDLATALSNQPFLTVSKPLAVTVGGVKGLFVKVAVPQDAELSACQGGQVTFVGDIDDQADRGWDTPGTVERMWILDVDGTRHILHANVVTGPGATDATKHTQAMSRMVESITFTHG